MKKPYGNTADLSAKNKIDGILHTAKKVHHYNELLIVQCDRWLSEEEGNRNMEKKIRERRGKR
ncbi:MAG: hypothetical protein LBI82_08355 [Dysgonamonadaceae bacterium]|jgi:hypothetical protein|nr:hypothetical protein [Dysgonamonadaceae bacterium]